MFTHVTETPLKTIEEAFQRFTERPDIAILVINQHVANDIRHLISIYSEPLPAIVEVPSKDAPYNPNEDSLMIRVKKLIGKD